MKSLVSCLLALLFVGQAYAQTNSYIGHYTPAAAAYQPQTAYRYYCKNGCYYKEAYTPSAPAPAATTVNNPVGALSTDNSVNYSYTINYSQLPANQGSTIMGYPDGVQTSADIHANIDFGALLNDTLRLSAQNASDANGILGKVGEHLRALSQDRKELGIQALQAQAIIASGISSVKNTEAQARLAEALQPRTTTVLAAGAQLQQQYSVTRGNGQTVVTPDPANPEPQVGDNLTQIQTLFANKCIACHNPNKKNGGLDLSDIRQLNEKQCDKILERVTSCDPAKRMPLREDGGEGVPLLFSEVKLLFKSVE